MNESAAANASPPRTAVRVRYRIRFAKTDLLRWISHRDLARLWERLVRRAELPLSMSEGFHPKPRIAFPSALALGVESWDEVVELELREELAPADLLDRLCRDRQPGLTIRGVKRLPDGFGKARLERSEYRIELPPSYEFAAVQAAIDRLLATPTVTLQRKKKTSTVHVPSQIESLELESPELESPEPELLEPESPEGRGHRLRLVLAASDGASLRPGDVLDRLELGDWTGQGVTITRTRVALQHEYETDDPRWCARAPQPDRDAPSEA